MRSLSKLTSTVGSSLLFGCLVATNGWAAVVTSSTQALDRVVAISRTATSPTGSGNTAAVEVQPTFMEPLFVTQKTGSTGFVNCQITATGSMVCLDAKLVRRWNNPAKGPEASQDLFSCTNSALGFDRKSDTCTSLTVDLSGAIWLAGKKSNTYSLVKVTQSATPASNPTSCPAGTWLGGDAADVPNAKFFCAQELAAGRPYFEDVNSAEGDRISSFVFGPGLAGVQTRSAIVYFQKNSNGSITTRMIADSKGILGLSGNEQVQSAALMKRDDGSAYFVYSTTNGKIRAVRAEENTTQSSVLLFDAIAKRGTTPTGCAAGLANRFGVRASPTTEQIYVSDRVTCRIWVLTPGAAANAFGFDFNTNPKDLPLSSSVDPSKALSPESPSVSPGVLVNFADFSSAQCPDPLSCPLLTNASGQLTVGMAGVALQSTESYMTLFQIKNIPDCRYLPANDTRCNTVANGGTLPNGTQLYRDYCPAGATSCGVTNAARRYLNVTPLLPSEVRTAFPSLPAMWISPQYRAQNERGYLFDALLGVPKDGVQFKDTFQLEFETDKLAGGASRCPPAPAALTEWDVVTTVSEKYATYSNGDLNNNDTIVNQYCGGSGTGGGRWSIYSYTLEPTTDTISVFNGDVYLNTNDDAVYAKMIDRLYDDLGATINNFVCPTGGALTTSCPTIQSSWANGRDKLTKCIGASTQPKQSSGDQNCQSFSSQLNQLQGDVAGVPANPADTANRIGEVKVRTLTIRHIFDTKFLPSIPAAGFCENPALAGNPCNMTKLN